MTAVGLSKLVEIIENRAAGQDRILVAIAGPPGSGKSTLARDLAARLGPGAAVLPMDGFHLGNEELREIGLLHRKGAPETFDAAGFIRLLHDLRGSAQISYPTFDRAQDRTVPDGGRIDAQSRIILIEGNYLLLDSPPWADLAGVFDLSVGIEVDRATLAARLVARWLEHGLSPAEAKARAQGNDMRNVDVVIAHSRKADYVLRQGRPQGDE